MIEIWAKVSDSDRVGSSVAFDVRQASHPAMSASIDRAQLRELLFSVLRTDSDFMAFVLDFFPDVHQTFGGCMDRVSRTNLLLESKDTETILDALARTHPDLQARLRQKYSATDGKVTGAPPVSAQPTASGSENASAPSDAPPQYDGTSAVRQGAHAAKVFADGAPIQWADRDEQTKQVRKLWPMREHRLLFLPGAQEEAHGMFLARIERILPRSPDCQVIHVFWPSCDSLELPEFPTTEAELLHALATSLGGKHRDDLGARLAYHLHLHDLLVIHPKVSRHFAEDSILLQYYTNWIPKELAGLHATHRCKFVQPVSWSKSAGFLQQLGQWLTRQKQPRDEAYGMMYSVETGAAKTILPVTRLHELSPIQYDHVIAFLRRCKYAEKLPPKDRDRKREELAKFIMSGKATSEIILNRLSKELADVEDSEDDEE